ncbi:MAG: hypothetical protein AB1921_16160 [Thermodesulfobacteriota bacterium]
MNQDPDGASRPADPASGEAGKTCTGPCGVNPNLLICAALALMVILIYARTGGFTYVSMDDGIFLTENRTVQEGLTWKGVKYAFTEAASASNYYIPIVWLSHMAAVSLFGLNPGAAHLVNALLHLLNCLLFFAAFSSLTGRRWESAFAAALFAVHPIHVESVAWVTERKDLLAGFFFMLTLLSYSRYAKRPGIGRYLLTFLCFLLGLLSKPILVVLPCVLLLLDYWPLGRLTGLRSGVRLSLEKLPFFIPVPIATSLAIHFQSKAGVLYSFAQYSAWRRVGAAVTGYLIYLKKLFLPTDLAINYPYPEALPVWQVAAAFAFLAAVTAWAFLLRRKAPWFLVGWLWFLGVLLPVSGIFVIGMYAVADRYAYLSFPGLYLAMAMAGGALVRKLHTSPLKAGGLACLLLAVMALSSWFQAGYWRNSVTLFSHSVAFTEDNFVSLYSLGHALVNADIPDRAEMPMLQAMVLRPDIPDPLNVLGVIYNKKGDLPMAATLFEAALAIAPGHSGARENLDYVMGEMALEALPPGDRGRGE